MIKKIIVPALLLLLAAPVMCDTIADYAGDTLSPWKFQATYKEKYFEYNTFYTPLTNPVSEMLRGMDQDFILKCGLPGGYGVSFDANYVFQNLEGLYDFNNVHSLSLIADKWYWDNLGFLLGFRYPLQNNIPVDYRLINNNDRMNLIAGVLTKGDFWLFKYTGQAVFEKSLRPSYFKDNYIGTSTLAASLGVNIYSNKEKQDIDLVVETKYGYNVGNITSSSSLMIIPQARIRFYNDFYFVIGDEIRLYAENEYLPQENKYTTYVVRINYLINSDIRSSAASVTSTSSATQGLYQYTTGTASAAVTPATVTAPASPVTFTAAPSQVTWTAGILK